MKDWMKPIILFLMVTGIAGIIVMISGVVNIAASSGHFRLTAWFLEFGKQRYVTTYTLMTKIPPLDDPGMIVRGAGHYEVGCRQCHGGPEHTSLLGMKMTPESPFLPSAIKKFTPDELFRIVKHGIKFTGMPAWPDLNRDDEVWSMVAFLMKLPEMNESQYKKLVYGTRDPLMIRPSPYSGEMANHVLMTCANCHNVDGNGRGEGAFPKLAGQNKLYLKESLEAYKRGERHSGTMEMMAETLSEDMIDSIADYYSRKERIKTKSNSKLSPKELQEAIERGSLIARKGIPHQKVAACIGCHGPDKNGETRKPQYPDLRGQPSSYLTNQLRLFLEDKRGGTIHAKIMKEAVLDLNEAQRRDVSLFYESLLQEE